MAPIPILTSSTSPPLSPILSYYLLKIMNRSTAVEELKQNGAHPYPHKFHVTTSLTHFLEQYASLKVNVGSCVMCVEYFLG